MKYSFVFVLVCLALGAPGCHGDPANSENPAVIDPGTTDTSGVKTVPQSPDSNVINTDSAGLSR